ncbi:type VI secretion system tube protein Hcp [Parashewanella tropica]|uniref:type VI secretion system tube protein Hcp n=1 Tax=Parashewanella tropica TaxID=2547970 RepID=UPI001059D8E4|nr:type VI secretion system tube protein Hcp [Parashewanella tropica]
MASIYMQIDGVSPNGAATVDGLDGDGWIALTSLTWGGVRNVGMEVGDATNSDKGIVAVQEVNVTKMADGASEFIMSILYSPGAEGKEVTFVATVPMSDGSGVQIAYQMKLTNSKISSYNKSISEGGIVETIAFTYNEITQKHNFQEASGDMSDGGLVTFDVGKGAMTSGEQS